MAGKKKMQSNLAGLQKGANAGGWNDPTNEISKKLKSWFGGDKAKKKKKKVPSTQK